MTVFYVASAVGQTGSDRFRAWRVLVYGLGLFAGAITLAGRG